MKINVGQEKPVTSNPSSGKTVVSMNPVRERVILDKDGNQIDGFRTKRIVKVNTEK